MYVVGFNGPPQCGKDTLAMMLAECIDQMGHFAEVKLDNLSWPLRKVAYTLTDMQLDYRSLTDDNFYEEFKQSRFGIFDRTGREIMIDVSERFLKPCYGKQVMAEMLLKRNAEFNGVLLIRDSGFQCEVNPITRCIGDNKLLIVRVHRKGCTFANDSREWVQHTHFIDVGNHGSLTDLRLKARMIYDCMRAPPLSWDF